MFSYDTVVMDIPIIEDQSTDHSDDRAAITALIADIERGFNSNDADLLTSPLAGNASTVNVVGMHTADRDAALVTSRAGLGGPYATRSRTTSSPTCYSSGPTSLSPTSTHGPSRMDGAPQPLPR